MASVPPPGVLKIRESRIQDSLSRFLEQVANPITARPEDVADGSFILCSFAESIGRVLMEGSIWTVWESKRQVFGAVHVELGTPAMAVSAEEALQLIQLPPGAVIDQIDAGSLSVTWMRKDDGREAVRISSTTPRANSLWLFRPPVDVGSAEWVWYRKYLPGLKSQFVTVRALLQTRAAAEATLRRSRYEARVKHLGHERVKDFSKRLKEISELLDEVIDEDEIDCIDLTEDIAVSLLQELMGTGWAVRQVGRINADRPSYPALFATGSRGSSPGEARPESRLLDHVRARLEEKLADEDEPPRSSGSVSYDQERKARRRRLIEVARCYRALLDDRDLDRPPMPTRGEEAMSLLPVWTRVHEACRLLCRPRPASQDEYDKAADVWKPAVELTLALLPRHLELQPALPGFDAPPASIRRGDPSARNWLALWFSLEVLRSLGRRRQLDDREALRPARGSRVRAARGAAVRVLRRARRLLLPAIDVRGGAAPARGAPYPRNHYSPRDYNIIVRLLEEIGEQDGLNRYVAAEHLQHALEVCMSRGTSRCRRRSRSRPGGRGVSCAKARQLSVAEALSSAGGSADPARARRIAQAYSLTSLFHDVGHLLFPRDSIPHDSLDWDDPEIAAGLQKVGDSVSEAGGEVAQKCFEDLDLTYYTKEELARWRAQLGGREPNHGLLGAWYLHRVGLGVLDRSADLDGFRETQGEILGMAVRAVLLHGAQTGHVSADRDPVASMLILCNEVFEWDPGRHLAPAPSSIGRSFHVMAADVPAREPRDAWIKIPSLQVTAGDPVTGAPRHAARGSCAEDVARDPHRPPGAAAPRRAGLAPVAPQGAEPRPPPADARGPLPHGGDALAHRRDPPLAQPHHEGAARSRRRAEGARPRPPRPARLARHA
ncbi:MAG: hypothetical protein R3B70_13675 [Polyangiaceae bacterium]